MTHAYQAQIAAVIDPLIDALATPVTWMLAAAFVPTPTGEPALATILAFYAKSPILGGPMIQVAMPVDPSALLDSGKARYIVHTAVEQIRAMSAELLREDSANPVGC